MTIKSKIIVMILVKDKIYIYQLLFQHTQVNFVKLWKPVNRLGKRKPLDK